MNIRFYAVSALITAGVSCAAQTKAPKFEVGFGTTFPKLQAEKIWLLSSDLHPAAFII
jgi:hypothetical protein